MLKDDFKFEKKKHSRRVKINSQIQNDEDQDIDDLGEL
jgi:hypothetical protein